MQDTFENKVALITGGGSGIGAATATIFATKGASVVVVDRNDEGGWATVSQIKDSGGNAIFIHADVSDESEVSSAIAQAIEEYGRIDCAFNNAGIGGEVNPVEDYSRESWDRVIAVNLTGVWLCMQQEIRHMLRNDGGTIVNMASTAGLQGNPLIAAYSASKHGVIGITRSAAKGYGSKSIRINAVCPAVIDTPLAAPIINDPAFAHHALSLHALGRFGEPREVGEVVAWLCSDAASFITGAAIPIDAGATA